jgi:hypothetical protein
MIIKFSDTFSYPQHFSDGSFVVSGAISAEDAAEIMSEELGEVINASELKMSRVRYGFAPEHVDGLQGQACWYTGAGNGKGTMPVWVLP